MLWHDPSLREFVSGSRHQGRVRSLRDLLGVMPIPMIRGKELDLQPFWPECRSETTLTSPSGPPAHLFPLEEHLVEQRGPGPSSPVMHAHSLTGATGRWYVLASNIVPNPKVAAAEAVAWLYSLWQFCLEETLGGHLRSHPRVCSLNG